MAFPTYVPDLDREILLETQFESLDAACSADSYTVTLCTPTFWRNRFARDYVDLGVSADLFDYRKALRDVHRLEETADELELLRYAVKMGSFAFVKYLWERMEDAPQAIEMLNYACRWSTVPIVDYFVQMVDQSSLRDDPLIYASSGTNHEVIHYLLDKGMAITPIWLVQVAKQGDIDTLDYLYSTKREILTSYFESMLNMAARRARRDFVFRLLDYFPNESYERLTMLKAAYEGGDLQIIKRFDEDVNYNINRRLINTAAQNGHLDEILYLQSKATFEPEELEHAFMIAAEQSQINVMDYLLEQGVEIANIENLFVSCLENSVPISTLDYLLHHGMTVTQEELDNSVDECLNNDQAYLVYWLLDHGAVPPPDSDALRHAVDTGDLGLVERIFNLGADADAIQRALNDAIEISNLPIFKYLVERGASLEDEIKKLSDVTIYLATIAIERGRKV